MIDLQTDKIQARIEARIGWVTFNNPPRRNAVSLEMWRALGDVMEALEEDPEVRVAVLTGAGGSFVSGADISEFETQRSSSEQRHEYGKISGRGFRALNEFSKPLLAMIRGHCIGGGLAIALAADLRFAAPGSRFGIPAARLGLGYDYAGVAALARLVGPAAAADILYSARTLDTEEAQRMGLISFVVAAEDLERRVEKYASTVAANAPLTLRAAKASLATFARYSRLPEAAAVEELVNRCFDSEDYREGRRAFMEKRPPQFRGR
jgi:enoyl-CoA hydratase/carnithine racemase